MNETNVKVTIPREVAEAIEYIKSRPFPEGIIETHIKCNRTGWVNELTPINGMSVGDLIRAVFVGYEIEQSPEDRLRERFDVAVSWARDGDNYARGVVSGVKETLNTLGITIEGIND